MTTRIKGPQKWSMDRNRDGDREYTLVTKVFSDTTLDGPAAVLQTDGLPQAGDFWTLDNDYDLWATCKLDAQVKPVNEGEPNTWWEVTQKFSTKGDDKRCKDQQIDNPLLKPMELSGGSQNYQEEATIDRFGRQLLTSSYEQLKGPQVEFDANRSNVSVTQWVAALDEPICNAMVNTVNTVPMWGHPVRTVKLSKFTWSRKFYGVCLLYFERKFEFDIRSDGFDRLVPDVGTKALGGPGSRWDPVTGLWIATPIPGYVGTPNPNPADPRHFVKFTDRQSQPAQCFLDGRGFPANGNLGTGATAGAAIDILGGEIIAINVFTGGQGYSVAPQVVLTGGLFQTAATATAVISNGQVTAVNITNPGTGYLVAPEVSFYTGGPASIPVQKYLESNFFLLGIPISLDSLQ